MAYYHVWEIFNELESVSGKNAKLEILNKHKDNTELQNTFKLALSPLIQFYIRQIPEYEPANNDAMHLRSAYKKLEKLSSRQITGNNAKEYLKKILSGLNENDAKILEKVIKGDLGVGVAIGSANKVWPNLVPTFSCMLCSSYSDENMNRIEYPSLIQEKCDGMRVAAIIRDSIVDLRTRNGKPIDIYGALDDQLRTIGNNCVIDGEFLVLDENGNIMPRKTGNGIINKAMQGKMPEKMATRIVFVVWDIIPLSDWEKGFCEYGHLERFNHLKKQLKIHNPSNISIPETEIVNNYQQAKEFYRRMLDSGREGAVLKNFDGPWEDKRVKTQVKMKVECEIDLIVKEMLEGNNRLEGKLGAILCESSDGKLQVKVGSGFSDEQRERKDLVGKIVTIKANEVISSEGKDTKSLFLPVFVEIRDDKDEAESLDEIMDKFRNV